MSAFVDPPSMHSEIRFVRGGGGVVVRRMRGEPISRLTLVF